jgi:hypothetical protein
VNSKEIPPFDPPKSHIDGLVKMTFEHYSFSERGVNRGAGPECVALSFNRG